MELLGTGSYLPGQVLTNDELSNLVDTSDDWIFQRTGIKERRLAKHETTSEMAVKAGHEALKKAGVQAEEIDLIVLATVSPDCMIPSAACQVQSEIGAFNAVAFDVNAACSGFIFALNTVYAYLKAGIYQIALVIGTETFSNLLNWNDRKTCVLFGDGAGAVVLRNGDGLYHQVLHSNGSGGNVLTCGNRDRRNPLIQETSLEKYIKMDGKEVFKFAVSKVPECINELLQQSKMEKEHIKYIVLHQANIRIIKSIAKRLELPESKFPTNLEDYGNTSAASIPILLDEMNKKGLLRKKDRIILSGFGGGLTWGAILMEW
ncbi:MAG: ketoacyl-ACP synthase III [Hungatella sp.]|jgi:3-oxoacyl-[acyl-carrier-protein] synthase-3|nr:ketoacyl-ACP synthase III [Hungatella sp.]